MAEGRFSENGEWELWEGGGAASSEVFEPDQKLLPVPLNFEKIIALAFLKAAWLQILYWVHFTFKV